MSKQGERIPWFEPAFDGADIEAVAQVVRDGFVNEGPKNREFEKLVSEFFDVPFACTTPSCTMAIALSLMALGIKPGESVLVPDITFIGTASAVRLAGAEPVLVDVDPQTFNMDPGSAAERIRPDTRAIVAVHLNGRSADMDALGKLASEHDLKLIEDAAEALASRNASGYLGTQSDAGCFSFAPTKIITSGQGGFILTRSQETRDNIVRLKDHGRLSRASDVHPVTGFNFKVTDMQMALALSQWNKLAGRIERSRTVDRRYVDGLSDIAEIEFTARPEHGGYLMWPDFKCDARDKLVEHAKNSNIILRPFWPALHRQPAYEADEKDFPGAVDACTHACWLPSSPAMTDAQIDRIIETIRGFFGK